MALTGDSFYSFLALKEYYSISTRGPQQGVKPAVFPLACRNTLGSVGNKIIHVIFFIKDARFLVLLKFINIIKINYS